MSILSARIYIIRSRATSRHALFWSGYNPSEFSLYFQDVAAGKRVLTDETTHPTLRFRINSYCYLPSCKYSLKTAAVWFVQSFRSFTSVSNDQLLFEKCRPSTTWLNYTWEICPLTVTKKRSGRCFPDTEWCARFLWKMATLLWSLKMPARQIRQWETWTVGIVLPGPLDQGGIAFKV